MFIIEIIIELIFASLVEFLGSILFELGFGSLVQPFRKKKETNPAYVLIGLVFLGAILGLIISFYFPNRIIQISPVPGISLLISPLLAGYSMEYFGKWRKSKGKDITSLATFKGGAVFAFSASIIRFWLIGGFV